eukprot:2614933-Pyramimonas_sp.AAC.1
MPCTWLRQRKKNKQPSHRGLDLHEAAEVHVDLHGQQAKAFAAGAVVPDVDIPRMLLTHFLGRITAVAKWPNGAL